ncbi:MAG: hypothetical protein HY655_09450 [Acidobacteria bacterium]|nr:hypothetical protein [Acidobacteriota bacterium]
MWISPASDHARSRGSARAAVMAVVAALAGCVLVLTGSTQLYDTNFQTLWEATELLAGDHPYRDFLEWGLPLQAVVSAVAQILSGHRLIGEFLVQWIFIITGVVISLHLGIQLSRSIPAALVPIGLAVLLLAATPTYHYPKLFFYPLALWLSWRYMERPGVRRGAALGLVTALAFLFRHDHGIYVGLLALVTFGLARAAVPAARTSRAMLADSSAYTAAVAIVLVPWLALVHVNEGVPEYVRSRVYLYEDWSASDSPYRALLMMNPIRTLIGERWLPPKPAVVSITWNANVDAAKRAELERRHRLRPLPEEPDDTGRRRYEVPNIYDVGLWELRGEMENADSAEGFEWDRVERLQAPLFVPTRDAAQTWLHQVALLVPLLLLISGASDFLRAYLAEKPVPFDCYRIAAAAAFFTVIEASLFRETSYVMVVIPLIAAVSARFLARRPPAARNAYPRIGAAWGATRLGLVALMLAVTSLATFAYTRGTKIFEPVERSRTVGPLFRELMTVPPLDAYQPAAAARQYDRQMWDSGVVDKGRLLVRYIHDCSRADDRILVTGSTPYHVTYYANRRVAGGHVFWHHGWRSDPVREGRLLELLQNQSVPFAFSTHDPVFADLKRYPRIHEYFRKHYAELDGTRGLVLVDTRRQPTSRFGHLGFPCFR